MHKKHAHMLLDTWRPILTAINDVRTIKQSINCDDYEVK